jgi:hypothetical protein
MVNNRRSSGGAPGRKGTALKDFREENLVNGVYEIRSPLGIALPTRRSSNWHGDEMLGNLRMSSRHETGSAANIVGAERSIRRLRLPPPPEFSAFAWNSTPGLRQSGKPAGPIVHCEGRPS